MPESYEQVPAETLRPGDQLARYLNGADPHIVISGPEPAEDPFGREGHFQYLCRTTDGTHEGLRVFGPGGWAFRLIRADKNASRETKEN